MTHEPTNGDTAASDSARVEAAARAICEAMGLSPDCLHIGDAFPQDGSIVYCGVSTPAFATWRRKVKIAQAALTAAGVPELVAERSCLVAENERLSRVNREMLEECEQSVASRARATAAEARVADLEAELARAYESVDANWVSHQRLTAAESKLAECERDAARYRWLRNNCENVADEYGTAGQLYFGTYSAGHLDAAIDGAIAARGEAQDQSSSSTASQPPAGGAPRG